MGDNTLLAVYPSVLCFTGEARLRSGGPGHRGRCALIGRREDGETVLRPDVAMAPG